MVLIPVYIVLYQYCAVDNTAHSGVDRCDLFGRRSLLQYTFHSIIMYYLLRLQQVPLAPSLQIVSYASNRSSSEAMMSRMEAIDSVS